MLNLLQGAVLYRMVAMRQANRPPYEHVKLDEAGIAAHQEAYEMLCDLTDIVEPL
jgi:hypothetical protein